MKEYYCKRVRGKPRKASIRWLEGLSLSFSLYMRLLETRLMESHS